MSLRLKVKEKFGQKFDEEIRFFKGWMSNTRAVGAILPTSAVTARRMASVVNPRSGLPVLELGPGTGVITKAILERGISPEKLVSIEYSTEFFNQLKADFAGVHFINGDAFDLSRTLGALNGQQFDSVVSAVPLLNFPMHRRVELIDDLLARIPFGRPVVQISYGPMSPVVAMPDRYRIQHYDFVVRNIPPAQLWVYSKAH
ncbi:phospholipid N-methyltransferase PmtA [Sinorhizobium americanum]|uniref:Phosphatidylethanolamine N-methyltransferase /phosphatidyl-N-methylethanolamine N-methyltransferase n=1 Tax=Sinorhizobium americanum TaxID=194963 RepID=A0A1L3LHT3_9HYPH|nr:class I SAM-dependent methyltransferase [Sinorhizobium americanum]APG89660.1 RNA adenine methylase transferase [Sinorhizobium americanum]OAP36025.1 SAM-dependent methyltransferase [Sinorhizobium americanum]TCN36135.1 phosphatidylethanolamine N-methyltransferase /phosphatidyl-N-methylethanolamine N-methyltransferase [Sinorhizobium americanum]